VRYPSAKEICQTGHDFCTPHVTIEAKKMVLHYLILSSCVARRLMPGTTPNARHRGGSMFTVCGNLSQLTLADYVMILFQIILSGLLFLWLASFVFTRSCFHFFLYPPISLDL
jgi:hypothetical protein